MATTTEVQQTNAGVVGHVVIARDFVYVDWSQVDANLQNAFSFQSSIRVESAQVWATSQVPLKNGPVTATPSVSVASLPTIDGAIASFEALDASGKPTNDWNKSAAAIAFNVVATANPTIPKAQLIAAAAAVNPALAAVVSAALLFAPSTLSVNIGHTAVNVPIGRDGTGRITHIGTASR